MFIVLVICAISENFPANGVNNGQQFFIFKFYEWTSEQQQHVVCHSSASFFYFIIIIIINFWYLYFTFIIQFADHCLTFVGLVVVQFSYSIVRSVPGATAVTSPPHQQNQWHSSDLISFRHQPALPNYKFSVLLTRSSSSRWKVDQK